jgi:hypothetical protein
MKLASVISFTATSSVVTKLAAPMSVSILSDLRMPNAGASLESNGATVVVSGG